MVRDSIKYEFEDCILTDVVSKCVNPHKLTEVHPALQEPSGMYEPVHSAVPDSFIIQAE